MTPNQSPEGGETAVERLSRALEFYSAQAGGKATTAIVSTADLRLAIEALSSPQTPTAGEGEARPTDADEQAQNWRYHTEPVRDADHALHLLDDVDSIVRFCAVNMLDKERYYRGAEAMWRVVYWVAALSLSPTAGPSRGKGE